MSAKHRGDSWRRACTRLGAAALVLAASGCCYYSSDGTKLWGGPFSAVSAERSATCAIQRGGDVSCWGEERLVRAGKPPPGPFHEVAIDTSCAVGLRPTGQLEGWGEPGPFSCAPPPPGDYIAVSVQHEACAIRKGGDIVCWGLQGGVYQPPSGPRRPIPPRAPWVTPGPFTRVSMGASHTCAIRAGGALRCWGDCTFRNNKTADCPARVAAPVGVWTELASGENYSCALSDLGEITCWGEPSVPMHPPAGKGFRAISARGDTTCAIDARQEIQCWGRPLLWGTRTYTPPAGPFVGLSVGGVHVCGLQPDGKLSCWGVDQQGQVTGRAPWPRA